MGIKIRSVLIGSLLVVAGCDKVERVTGPIWPPPKPIEPITLTPEFIQADAIAGFENRFRPWSSWSLKNTGTAKRWAYAYYTPIDSQTVIASKYLLVNPGATWSDGFNVGCSQLDLSTQAVSGRPDIGHAFYDKRGNIINSGDPDKTARINECRTPAYRCVSTWEDPNSNCAECSDDRTVCLVPR